MERTIDKHESYGMVGASRVHGGSGVLFGSSIRHHNFVRLRVSRASVERDLNTNWYYAEHTKPIIEVEMSPTQWAEMITCMNVGDGVPCTLRYVDGKQMEAPPQVDQRRVFDNEFKKKIHEVMERAVRIASEAESILSEKTIKVAERERLKGALSSLITELRSNIPFTYECFNEAMDKTTVECKGEVEAFVQHKIVSLGIESLRRQIEDAGPEMPEAKLMEHQ